MRALNQKNKRSFFIFGAISIIIFSTFSLLIINSLQSKPQTYIVQKETITNDKDFVSIDVQSEGVLSKNWDGMYILSLSEKSYEMGNKAVLYNPFLNSIDIHGGGNEVLKDLTVDALSNFVTVKDLDESKFYKIDDRRYLMTGADIKASDNSFSSRYFVEIIIDKAGFPQFITKDMNFKVLQPLTLVSDHISFDISNEVLTIDGIKMDLKKINGSTNEYNPGISVDNSGNNDNSNDANKNDNNVNSGNSGSSGSTNNSGSSNSNSSGFNGNNFVTSNTLNNLLNALGLGSGSTNSPFKPGTGNNTPSSTKSTMQLNSINADITSANVRYYVSDPLSKYATVYLDIEDASGTKLTRIVLSKEETSREIRGLSPNTTYGIKLGYTARKVIAGDEKDVEEVVDYRTITTTGVKGTITVNKLLKTSINVTVKINSSISIDSGKIKLYSGDDEIGSQELNVQFINTGWTVSLDIPLANQSDPLFKIKLEDIIYEGHPLETDIVSYIQNS